VAYNPAAKPNPAKVADEQAAVLDLRRKGYTIRQIATQLGLAKSTVQNRLDAAIAELVEPAAREVRLLELERLDAWQARLENQLDTGDDPAKVVPVALRVQERRAKLLGLDAPERAEVTQTVLPAADPAVEQLLAQAREATDG